MAKCCWLSRSIRADVAAHAACKTPSSAAEAGGGFFEQHPLRQSGRFWRVFGHFPRNHAVFGFERRGHSAGLAGRHTGGRAPLTFGGSGVTSIE